MNGRRVEKQPHELLPGEYCKVVEMRDNVPTPVWYACTPGSPELLASLAKHEVVEHVTGMISVKPSILVTGAGALRWHGYLTCGQWLALPDCCAKVEP